MTYITYEKETDADAVHKFLAETNWPEQTRIPTNALDFGDDATIGLHLKRVGYTLSDTTQDENQVFGRYLGRHPDGYVVAVSGVLTGFHTCEIFAFLPELKQHWQLD
jgi:hypothetical protein